MTGHLKSLVLAQHNKNLYKEKLNGQQISKMEVIMSHMLCSWEEMSQIIKILKTLK
jgi:hypothetical protein